MDQVPLLNEWPVLEVDEHLDTWQGHHMAPVVPMIPWTYCVKPKPELPFQCMPSAGTKRVDSEEAILAVTNFWYEHSARSETVDPLPPNTHAINYLYPVYGGTANDVHLHWRHKSHRRGWAAPTASVLRRVLTVACRPWYSGKAPRSVAVMTSHAQLRMRTGMCMRAADRLQLGAWWMTSVGLPRGDCLY